MLRKVCTSICYAVTGNNLDPDQVTAVIRLPPTESWKKGDTFNPKPDIVRQRPVGNWRLLSESVVSSNNLDDHIDWLITMLEPHSDAILRLLGDSDICVEIFIWESPSYGITVSNDRLAKLSLIAHSVRFVAFDESEDLSNSEQ